MGIPHLQVWEEVNYGFNGEHADSPHISRWLEKTLRPTVDMALKKNGHSGGPLVFGVDRMNFSKGLSEWTATPRFSNGYGDLIHLPTILVENHSLKPYKQRVLGTYVMLEQTLELLAEKGHELIEETLKDKTSRPEELVVKWKSNPKVTKRINFPGIGFQVKNDGLTGLDYVSWNGQPKIYPNLPVYQSNVADLQVKVAKYYWVPVHHKAVIERLTLHGIQYETIDKATRVHGVQLVSNSHQISPVPFEGHHQVKAEFVSNQRGQFHLPEGSVKVPSDQNKGRLVVALLDPRAPDSLFSWGFFKQMYQRTEYIENYVVVPLANKMLREDKNLRQAYNKKKKDDKGFAADSRQQLKWFYERSPFYDKAYLKYPVILTY